MRTSDDQRYDFAKAMLAMSGTAMNVPTVRIRISCRVCLSIALLPLLGALTAVAGGSSSLVGGRAPG